MRKKNKSCRNRPCINLIDLRKKVRIEETDVGEENERDIIKDKERKTSGLVVEETINKEENSESHSHKKERERAKNIEIGRNKSERHRYHAGRS